MKIIAFVLALILGLAIFEAAADNCPRVCTREHKPVCASLKRGKSSTRCTFSNRCILEKRKCRTQEKWRVVHSGDCGRQSSSCKSLTRG